MKQSPTDSDSQKRLIEHVAHTLPARTISGYLGTIRWRFCRWAKLESLALPGESYKLALTPGLIAKTFGGKVTDPMLEEEGRYVHSEGDTNWWVPSGRGFLSPGTD